MMMLLSAITLIVTNVVPTGWMPAKASDGEFVVRICSQGLAEPQRARFDELAQARVDRAMRGAGQHSRDDHQGLGDPCPYGVVANAFAVPSASPPMAEPVEEIEADLPHLASKIAIGMGLAAPPPPSTGPPIHS